MAGAGALNWGQGEGWGVGKRERGPGKRYEGGEKAAQEEATAGRVDVDIRSGVDVVDGVEWTWTYAWLALYSQCGAKGTGVTGVYGRTRLHN